MTEPTPIRWLFNESSGVISDARTGKPIVFISGSEEEPESLKRGRLIVTAVNCHEELVGALEEMCAWLAGWAEVGSAGPAYERAQAILAKARAQSEPGE